MTTCWKCADSDAAYQAKCTAPACGMRETAEPSTSNATLPVNWAAMIHYPECWDTAAYPELRNAIHEALAWAGCSVCKPMAASSTSPISQADAEALAHRIATTYTHRSAPGYSSYAFMPHALMDFVRAIEAAHGIALPPPAK